MFFYIFFGLIMTGCFIGMIVCAKKQAELPLARKTSFILLGVVLVCALAIVIKSMSRSEGKQLISNEMYYARVAAEFFGRHLAATHPGAKALIIVENKKSTNEHLKNRLDALKRGLGSAITIVDIDSPDLTLGATPPEGADQQQPQDPNAPPAPRVPPAPPVNIMMMPIQHMTFAIHFDDMIKRHPNCNLIISFIGLPPDAGDMAIWSQEPETRPKVAILHGEVFALKNAIASGAISAVVVPLPGAKLDEGAPPRKLQDAFDKRYLLITPQNVAEIAAKYSRLFAE